MQEIDFDLTELLSVFDELLPLSNEERKIYWLKSTREDGISVTLTFSVYEMTASVIIRINQYICSSLIEIANCREIKVLDEQRRFMEIIGASKESVHTRCTISLNGEIILNVETK